MSEKGNKPSCKFCNKSTRDLYKGACRDCDTSGAGTWFLSYLASLGFIKNDDTIQNGYVDGTTDKNFLGLPNGTEIHCEVDEQEKDIFHLKHNPNSGQNKYDDDDGELFWEKDNVPTIIFKVNIGIDIISWQ
jgi:hypothetical protein